MRSIRLVIAIVVITTAPARADDCENDGIGISMSDARQAVEPAHDNALHIDVAVRAIGITWGACEGLRHKVELSAFEAPDLGIADGNFWNLGRYQLEWHARDWSAYAGLRTITMWSHDVRVLTPVVGVRVLPTADLALAASIESGGVFAWSRASATRQLRGDVEIELVAAYPASAATRGELRARWRDYTIDEMRSIRDVTFTAGLGFALVARNGPRHATRGIPGFVGLALRENHDQSAIMIVTELAYAVTTD